MRFTSISSIAWLLLSASAFAQGKFAGVGGIVYGTKAAFNISAPDGWVVDPESGLDQGFPCVLYPKDSSWSDANTVMYAVVEEDFTEAAVFAASAVEQQKKRHHCIPKEKIASGKTKDGEAYFINEYPATATYSQWERVAYIQLPGAVGYVVLSSRNEGSYPKDKHFLEDVMETIFYVRKTN
jgi:hypothetical protein